MNERMERAEERIAWLERHVGEQDKVMLQLADDLARLRKELVQLRERSATGAAPLDPDERPPHY
jgi:SlyX protein